MSHYFFLREGNLFLLTKNYVSFLVFDCLKECNFAYRRSLNTCTFLMSVFIGVASGSDQVLVIVNQFIAQNEAFNFTDKSLLLLSS